ncbi:MAG TPA: hypothetical protein VIA80_19310 [Hyphomonadaceae bacterium]|jgi:hypothetical protein
MRKLITCLAVAAFAAPAFADTLKEVTTKGIVLSAQGFELDVAYKADGTFAVSMVGDPTPLASGKWRIDGEKLCTSTDATPEECVAYPTGKKSGDSFDVTGAQGTATIKIK